jgi:hypothetical protein
MSQWKVKLRKLPHTSTTVIASKVAHIFQEYKTLVALHVYEFKIALTHIKPHICRHIQVPENEVRDFAKA